MNKKWVYTNPQILEKILQKSRIYSAEKELSFLDRVLNYFEIFLTFWDLRYIQVSIWLWIKLECCEFFWVLMNTPEYSGEKENILRKWVSKLRWHVSQLIWRYALRTLRVCHFLRMFSYYSESILRKIWVPKLGHSYFPENILAMGTVWVRYGYGMGTVWVRYRYGTVQ